MLVLTRKLKEQIRIGDNVTITILRVNGNTVRVGIDAPRDVRIMRGELPPLMEKNESPLGRHVENVSRINGTESAAPVLEYSTEEFNTEEFSAEEPNGEEPSFLLVFEPCLAASAATSVEVW